jgi:ketosteroid isomerase-like protein
MLPHQPEDWPALFTQHLKASDLDGVMALYEPDARFVARSGEATAGHERIRDALAGLVRAKMNLRSREIKAVTAGDVVLLYTDFEGTALDPSGKRVESGYRAIEVLRLQPDGTWKLIVATPTAAAKTYNAVVFVRRFSNRTTLGQWLTQRGVTGYAKLMVATTDELDAP